MAIPNYLVMLGKRYKFSRTNLMPDCLGKCDAPNKVNKGIKVHKGLKDKKELEIILHECLHACFWHIDEEFIDAAAGDLARALWRIGYRKDDTCE